VVAGSAPAYHSALLLAQSHQPHFVSVVDRAGCPEEPAVFRTTGGTSDVVIFNAKLGLGADACN